MPFKTVESFYDRVDVITDCGRRRPPGGLLDRLVYQISVGDPDLTGKAVAWLATQQHLTGHQIGHLAQLIRMEWRHWTGDPFPAPRILHEAAAVLVAHQRAVDKHVCGLLPLRISPLDLASRPQGNRTRPVELGPALEVLTEARHPIAGALTMIGVDARWVPETAGSTLVTELAGQLRARAAEAKTDVRDLTATMVCLAQTWTGTAAELVDVATGVLTGTTTAGRP